MRVEFQEVAESVKEPQAFEGGWLWPITGSGGRSYKTLPETKRLSALEKGPISPLAFVSTSARPIFVRAGSIFSGLTQERSTVYSFVVLPGQTVSEAVRCIHRSRGLAKAKLKGAGLTPLLLDQVAYQHDRAAKGQLPYWGHLDRAAQQLQEKVKEIERELPSMALQLRSEFGHPQPDDLHQTARLTRAASKHLILKAEAVEGEVGVAFTTDRGLEVVEWFDSPSSWLAYRPLVLASLIGIKTKPSQPDRAVVLAALHHQFTTERSFTPHSKGLGNHNFTGEVTSLDGRVIHAQILAFRS